MCVIVFKPQNINLPESVINDCFTENPNGAGFTIIKKHNEIITRKGFMSLDELKTALNEYGNLDSLSLVLHFRIMTSGIVNPINTHPYPITNKPDLFTQLELKDVPVIYHNGVLFGKQTSYTEDIDLYSDSFLLARDILSRANITGIQNTLSMLASTTNNKFCYVNKHGAVYLYGTFPLTDGIYYSNMFWKNPIKRVYTAYEYNQHWYTGVKQETGIITPKPESGIIIPDKTRCIKCNQFLFTYEKESNLCTECECEELKTHIKVKQENNKIPKRDECLWCGTKLNKHESIYCDDCLHWKTNPYSYGAR